MKLLWLCNVAPGAVQEKINGKRGSGLWMEDVLSSLRMISGMEIVILCPSDGVYREKLDETCRFETFPYGPAYQYRPELQQRFSEILKECAPDVIHVWGTEYGHTLAMVQAAEEGNLLSRVVISLQGICSVIARHYRDGLTERICAGTSFRDLVRRDNILQQQKKFELRGELEQKALKKAVHVIGRTPWDERNVKEINPSVRYHFCNETLRSPFFHGQWQYESCRKHRVFASSCAYPVKGFHYLLEAMGKVRESYPDALLAVTGDSFFAAGLKSRLRRGTYQIYLAGQAKKYGMQDRIEFTGNLSAEQMRGQYLLSNVFVLPSTMENSPNSLGEAMLLGTPCVAYDVGGVAAMMIHEEEGLVVPAGDVDALADSIMKLFALEDKAQTMGRKAQAHARMTHDPETNLQALLAIYEEILKN